MTINLQGTTFSCSIAPVLPLYTDVATLTLGIENEFLSYNATETVAVNSLEEFIFCASRFLAGAYKKEYTYAFENTGIAVDMYPYYEDGKKLTKKELRENDCIMAIRLLMRSKSKAFLGGVYTLLLHRQEIKIFIDSLRKEFESSFGEYLKGDGQYAYVGVSPKGWHGCNYWYIDRSKTIRKGDYVWVKMGKNQTEQVVYVDSVRYFNEDNAPYPPFYVKGVLRKATKEDLLVEE